MSILTVKNMSYRFEDRLILDEPTNYLDVEAKDEFKRAVRNNVII